MNKKFQFALFYCSIAVYLSFYLSAFFTHTLSIFFVHITPGQDFFQIPNAAYAFLHGGSLTGVMPKGLHPYIACCGVNQNVYHPLFTLLVGIPLQVFPPWTAYGVWVFAHLAVTVVVVFFLWTKFNHHKYLYLALSLLLLNSCQYYEIWHAQYHFLFNFFTVLFLYESIKHGDTKKAGIWLFLSLLVKPIGLLWIVPLLLYKRIRTVAIGLGVYTIATGVFMLFPFGQYYLRNLTTISLATIPTHNLYAIQYLFPAFPLNVVKAFSILVAAALVAFQLIRRPRLYTIILLWTGYQLLFYPLVYHYQYTILAGLICLGILFDVFSPKSISMIPVIFLTLPVLPVLLFHLLGETVIPRVHLAMIWLYSAFWLSCLLVLTVFTSSQKSSHDKTARAK